MQLYAVRRRNTCSVDELAEVSARIGASLEGRKDIKWIRSYMIAEGGDKVGSVCYYQAESPDVIRDHAKAARIPANEIMEVFSIMVGAPDPKPHELT